MAVAEELHFTRAAQRLLISQPALSKQIEQLERQLRLRLVERSSRHVALTAAGRALLPGARDLLAAWAAVLGDVREAAAAEARTLRVGFIANAASELTPLITARFAQLRPAWRVAMRQASWTDATAGLGDGTVDVALLRTPVPGTDRFRTVPLLAEDRWVALSAAHPLAGQEVVRFEQLLDEPFVAVPPETGVWRDFWLAVDQRGGRPVRIGAEVRSSDEWMEAIAQPGRLPHRRLDGAVLPATRRGVPPGRLRPAQRGGGRLAPRGRARRRRRLRDGLHGDGGRAGRGRTWRRRAGRPRADGAWRRGRRRRR